MKQLGAAETTTQIRRWENATPKVEHAVRFSSFTLPETVFFNERSEVFFVAGMLQLLWAYMLTGVRIRSAPLVILSSANTPRPQTLSPKSSAGAPGPRSEKVGRLLGGSWVVISGVISPLIWIITTVTLLVTPLITTHEPPSSDSEYTFNSIPAMCYALVLAL